MTGRRPPPTTRELRQRTLPRRGLGLQESALYVGISAKLFARLVRMNRAPQPRLISTGRSQVERWTIEELDAFIDRLPRRGDAAGAPGAPVRLFNL